MSGQAPLVAVVMGSSSDLPSCRVRSTCWSVSGWPTRCASSRPTARRDDMLAFGQEAAGRGLRVLIAGAGGAAHLPGMLASVTTLPVIGVPVALSQLDGLDSLLSIVQMPKGVPVATMAVNGARNAGLLAVRILAQGDPELTAEMERFQEEIAAEARAQDASVERWWPTMAEPNLAQRLGYGAEAKLVIINADDLGSCHSANVGVYECLATGTVTSATLMVPCPWAREASSRYRGEDIGVHLTVNAEYELYRWGPITYAPSLLGGDGGFPRTVEDVWDHADLDEVRRECRAQIERAILWGFDVSHLDSHMATLQLRPEFFDVYLELALEFGLPLRMVSPAMERFVGFPARAVAAEAGAVFTDHFRLVPGVGSRQIFEKDLATLRPGVTELHLHPAVDSAELRSLATDDWEARVDDHRLICDEDWVRRSLDDAGATLIGYRPLRDLARSGG